MKHRYKTLGIITFLLLFLSFKCSSGKLCKECTCHEEKEVLEQTDKKAKSYFKNRNVDNYFDKFVIRSIRDSVDIFHIDYYSDAAAFNTAFPLGDSAVWIINGGITFNISKKDCKYTITKIY